MYTIIYRVVFLYVTGKMNRRQNTQRHFTNLNNLINKVDLVDMYIILPKKITEYIFFYKHMWKIYKQ